MDTTPDNPITNKFRAGVTDEQVRAAVEKSGYPLQTVTAEVLREKFHVHEEWSYIDRDTDDLRTIDIHAQLRLHELEPQLRVRPQLNLLIECKQSELPFIFFLTPAHPWLPDFPVVAGLRNDKILITSDDDPSSWTLCVLNALDLGHHAFYGAPQYCTTFSKCVRTGSDIQLSGAEAYNGLILPLIKAQQHFAYSEQPVETAVYFDLHLTVALSVIDAPMVSADCSGGKSDLKLLPWVRVVRHEYLSDKERWDRSKLWVVDVVHKDYLSRYVDDHLVPFAQRYATLALKHQEELAAGKAFVSGMGKDCWKNIEERLSPTGSAPFLSRTKAAGKEIMRQIVKGKDENET